MWADSLFYGGTDNNEKTPNNLKLKKPAEINLVFSRDVGVNMIYTWEIYFIESKKGILSYWFLILCQKIILYNHDLSVSKRTEAPCLEISLHVA